jgi:hypothetical protein
MPSYLSYLINCISYLYKVTGTFKIVDIIFKQQMEPTSLL